MSLSPFQTAARAGLAPLYAGAAVSITYTRSAQSVTLSAIRNDRGVDVVDAEGVYTRVPRNEYQLKKADLVLGETEATPQRGDVITDGGSTFRVQEGVQDLHEGAEWQFSAVGGG